MQRGPNEVGTMEILKPFSSRSSFLQILQKNDMAIQVRSFVVGGIESETLTTVHNSCTTLNTLSNQFKGRCICVKVSVK